MNRKLTLTALLALTAICASAQIAPDADWAQFGRYAADNENNIVCRGISGQTSSQMLIRFRQDVIELHPEYVVIRIFA